jgi:hypothetical protein
MPLCSWPTYISPSSPSIPSLLFDVPPAICMHQCVGTCVVCEHTHTHTPLPRGRQPACASPCGPPAAPLPPC